MPNLCGISQKLLAEAVKGVNEEKKRRRSVSPQFCVLPSNVHAYVHTYVQYSR